MSSSPSFRCPVCRAQQTLRDECRRCQADLRLVVRARRRVAYPVAERRRAKADGDAAVEQQAAAELKLLAPKLGA
ncbi:MAG: hypothetical protein AAF961_17835 [Planctomycetota bacterium]